MTKRHLRVLIAEGIPSLNKGELAILLGMLETFNLLGESEVSVFSFLPHIDKDRYPKNVGLVNVCRDLHIDNPYESKQLRSRLKTFLFPLLQHSLFAFLYSISRKKCTHLMRSSIWTKYLDADVMIICHDQVSCVGGYLLPLSPVYITFLARVLRKPIVLYGNGTPDIQGWLNRLLARFVLKNVTFASMRELDSYKKLREIAGPHAPLFLTGDPAVLAPSLNLEDVAISSLRELVLDSDIIVGVTMTRSILQKAFKGSGTPQQRYLKAIDAIARAFDLFVDEFSARLVFLPHCIEYYDNRDDRIVARAIYQRMQKQNMVVLIEEEYSTQQLKGFMKIMKAFIGARIHSVIGALTVGVPSCTIASQSDVRATGLIGRNFQQSKWIYYIEELNSSSLAEHLSSMIKESPVIRKQLRSIYDSIAKQAMLNGILLRAAVQKSFDLADSASNLKRLSGRI